jgi:tripartite ATP-independent transporter DctM subunit
MGLVGFVFYVLIAGTLPGLAILGLVPYSASSSYTFTVIPLFVLMGNVAFAAGYGEGIFQAARECIGQVRGGVAMATVLGCAGFAASCGSSVATTTTIGKIAVPEMEKLGYDRGLSIASVAASGTLASMIPPSILMVVYGMITEQSIGKMLVAGFLPGLVTAAVYITMIFIRTQRNPNLAPATERSCWKEKFASLKNVWGILMIFSIVMGGIYGGIFTPTEAGGIGAAASFFVAATNRRLNWKLTREALLDTAKMTAMICCVMIGAFIYSYQFSITRLPTLTAEFIGGLSLPPMLILALIMIMYIVLGTFMMPLAMLFLTLPIVFPTIQALGFDPIWFGILVVHVCELGMITPPYGVTLFAIKAVLPNLDTRTLLRGVAPFICADAITLTILILFPQITLFLPNMMGM